MYVCNYVYTLYILFYCFLFSSTEFQRQSFNLLSFSEIPGGMQMQNRLFGSFFFFFFFLLRNSLCMPPPSSSYHPAVAYSFFSFQNARTGIAIKIHPEPRDITVAEGG
jgi:hypothetical protein